MTHQTFGWLQSCLESNTLKYTLEKAENQQSKLHLKMTEKEKSLQKK